MKINSILILSILIFSGFSTDESPKSSDSENAQTVSNSIEWKDFESVNKLSANNEKKYFIYVYTGWCSWCKRMSSTTFQDEEIIEVLNNKFIPIKFNAESKDPINFREHAFKFISNGKRGYHELAAALLNNKLSYPSIVFLDEDMNMIQPLPGYKSAEDLNIILHFLGDKIYETMSFEDYQLKMKK